MTKHGVHRRGTTDPLWRGGRGDGVGRRVTPVAGTSARARGAPRRVAGERRGRATADLAALSSLAAGVGGGAWRRGPARIKYEDEFSHLEGVLSFQPVFITRMTVQHTMDRQHLTRPRTLMHAPSHTRLSQG